MKWKKFKVGETVHILEKAGMTLKSIKGKVVGVDSYGDHPVSVIFENKDEIYCFNHRGWHYTGSLFLHHGEYKPYKEKKMELKEFKVGDRVHLIDTEKFIEGKVINDKHDFQYPIEVIFEDSESIFIYTKEGVGYSRGTIKHNIDHPEYVEDEVEQEKLIIGDEEDMGNKGFSLEAELDKMSLEELKLIIRRKKHSLLSQEEYTKLGKDLGYKTAESNLTLDEMIDKVKEDTDYHIVDPQLSDLEEIKNIVDSFNLQNKSKVIIEEDMKDLVDNYREEICDELRNQNYVIANNIEDCIDEYDDELKEEFKYRDWISAEDMETAITENSDAFETYLKDKDLYIMEKDDFDEIERIIERTKENR